MVETASGGNEAGGGPPARGAPLPGVRAALLVAPVRFALGLAGLVAAAATGHAADTALAAAAVGAVLTIFTLASPGGRRRPQHLRPSVPQASADEAWWRVLLVAMFPSTYGVALFAAISFAVDRNLAAFLSGVLLGMGAVAAAYVVRLRA